MLWINKKTGEQTTDETKVAGWVSNGEKVGIYVWCDAWSSYIIEDFN